MSFIDDIQKASSSIGLGYEMDDWMTAAFNAKALKDRKCIYRRSVSGFIKDAKVNIIEGFDAKAIQVSDNDSSKHYYSDSSIYYFWLTDNGEVEARIITTDKEAADRFEGYAFQYIAKTKRNIIHTIVSGGGGYKITALGTVVCPLISENYTEKVAEDFEYVIEQLKLSHPSGRLMIINGEAGTGKTFYVRGLINELEDHSIILLPTKLASELDCPSLLPMLIDYREEKQRPILIIMEDADECLLQRDGMNISYISSMLNNTDGILGDLLDLRIIATTNAANLEIDSALLRPGRLLRHINIDRLNKEQATKIYRRLVEDELAVLEVGDADLLTLAEIYQRAGNTKSNIIVTAAGDDYTPNAWHRYKTRRVGF